MAARGAWLLLAAALVPLVFDFQEVKAEEENNDAAADNGETETDGESKTNETGTNTGEDKEEEDKGEEKAGEPEAPEAPEAAEASEEPPAGQTGAEADAAPAGTEAGAEAGAEEAAEAAEPGRPGGGNETAAQQNSNETQALVGVGGAGGGAGGGNGTHRVGDCPQDCSGWTLQLLAWCEGSASDNEEPGYKVFDNLCYLYEYQCDKPYECRFVCCLYPDTDTKDVSQLDCDDVCRF